MQDTRDQGLPRDRASESVSKETCCPVCKFPLVWLTDLVKLRRDETVELDRRVLYPGVVRMCRDCFNLEPTEIFISRA